MGITRTVYGLGTRRTLRPLWALHELGLEFNHEKIAPRGPRMDEPEFLAINPRHKVPFYQDDRVQMGESAAIVLYLADRHGGDVMRMPAPGTEERAMLQERTLFIMMEIDARMYTVRLHGDPPEGLSHIYGSAPVAVDAAIEYALKSLQEAARWLHNGQQYVMGEHFGATDLLLVSCLDWALEYNMDLPVPLGDYRDQIASRPSYKVAMAGNFPSEA